MLPSKILAPHPQITSTVVQEAWISFTFLSITCKNYILITYFLLIFLTSLWLVIVITFRHHCSCLGDSYFKIAKQASRENALQKVKSRFCYDIVKIIFKYQQQSFL